MFTGKKHRLDRWEAAIMLFGYAGHVACLVYRRQDHQPTADL